MSNGNSFELGNGQSISAATATPDVATQDTESYYFKLMRPIQDRGPV